MRLHPYDRAAAVAYARQWALGRNPAWYNFDGLGGDCTNFISQCLHAGRAVMNYTPNTGWYYRNLNDRAPAWTGVQALGSFLRQNQGVGPIARQVDLRAVEPGDVIQLCSQGDCYHTLLVTQILRPTPAGILICAHSSDSLDRPLATYEYEEYRAFHMEGVNLW